MEAVAKHDFQATAEDELSFRRGQVLKVCSLHSWAYQLLNRLYSLGIKSVVLEDCHEHDNL